MPIGSLLVFSTISFVAVLLPSPWHWRVKNVATLALIFWLALANLNAIINTALWANNVVDWSPGFCDICASSLAVTAARPELIWSGMLSQPSEFNTLSITPCPFAP
jgi:pheromone a factor receptor